jgi:hypothetical protein
MRLFKKKKKKPALKPNKDLETIELPVGLEKKKASSLRQSPDELSVTDNGSETIDK